MVGMVGPRPSKALRSRTFPVLWRLFHCLLILRAGSFNEARAQVSAGAPVGSLQTTGEVYLNGKPAGGEQTVFGGEDVRTGANGAAALNVPVTGVVNIASQTDVSIGGVSRITLRHGTVAARSFRDGKGMEIEFETFVARMPFSEGAAAGAVTVGPAGDAKVECLDGALFLARSEGSDAVTLHLGQSVKINADGKIQGIETMALSPASAAGQPPYPSQTPGYKKSPAAYIILGAATAGGIGAATAALLHKAGSQPISPSSP